MQQQIPRAPRVSTDSKILYSEIDRLEWHAGWTKNLSSSGLLFEGKYLIPPGTAVEMTFAVPREVFGIAERGAAEQVYCTGVIVRTDAGSKSGKLAARMGTRITSRQGLLEGQGFR
jgi:hypothetical protein